MIYRMNLRLFEDGTGAGSEGQGANAGAGNGSQSTAGGNGNQGNTGAAFSFEQAEEIANARAHRAEQAALKSYFQQQGMTEQEVQQALEQFKQKKQSQQPNVSQMQQERDNALNELSQMKNEKILSGKGVKAEDIDYVMFKVSKLVDDKTDFTKAAEKFLKDNPRFTGQTYRVSTGTQSNGNEGTGNGNDFINAAIRRAAGR